MRNTVQQMVRLLVGSVVVMSCADETTAPAGSGVLAVEVRAPNDSLFFGRSMQLLAAAIGDAAVVARPTITWRSSDTLAVVVNGDGLVTAVGFGTATITATVADQQASYVVRAVPMHVAPNGTVVMASRSHLGRQCGLNAQGHAMCVIEPTAPDTIPRFALLPDATNHVFTSFSSGYESDCGMKADGSLWCTRTVSDFILATGAEFGATQVFRPVRTTLRFSAFGVGGHTHICAIGRDDGLVRCWGHSHLGVLGRPNVGNDRDSVTAPVLDAPPLTTLSTNQQSACGVDAAGRAICWGSGARHKGMRSLVDTTIFGPGNLAAQSWYARVRDDAPPFVAVETDDHVTCGLTAGGEAYCWGDNREGQLGIGSTTPSTAVERVETPVRFRALYAVWWDQSQMCGVSTDDALYCWGLVDPAPLGVALGTRRYAPVRLLPGVAVEGVMLGTNRRCAVTRAGGVLCW
jgi:hypothetical protein